MSPWFKLYIYNAAKSGPDSILFPKGLRVNYLPEVFEVSERQTSILGSNTLSSFRLASWLE